MYPMYLSEFFIVSHDSYVAYNVFRCRSKDLKRREDCASPFLRNSNSLVKRGYGGEPMYHGQFFIVSFDSYTAYNVFQCRFKDPKRREDCASPFLHNSNSFGWGGMKGTPCISVSSSSFPVILMLIRMYLNVCPRI